MQVRQRALDQLRELRAEFRRLVRLAQSRLELAGVPAGRVEALRLEVTDKRVQRQSDLLLRTRVFRGMPMDVVFVARVQRQERLVQPQLRLGGSRVISHRLEPSRS